MNPYDRYVLPILLNACCGAKPIRYQRKKIVPKAHGRVLELGIGSGLNLPFYDPARVSEVIGVDPSEELWRRAQERLAAVSFPVTHHATTIEAAPIKPGSIDSALITYTLCTIPDAVSALVAVRGYLKPEGEVLFCEHGLAPDEGVARWQGRLNGIWGVIGGGCHLNRRIPDLIGAAGLKITRLETMYLPSTPKWAGYNYWGAARAA